MISASLPGEALAQLGQLSHVYPAVPPPPGMTPEFLAPRPYARYPPRPPRPRDPPAPPPSAPTFPPMPSAYTRFLSQSVSYPHYLYRPQTPAPAPAPPASYPIRPRPTSGFVPPAPAPRSPPVSAPTAPISTAAPDSPVSPERAAPAPYFYRGALIRLEDGTLRRVEDMRTEDFVASADRCADLTLTHCTLLRLDERGDQLSLTLAYDKNRSQVELESTVDHPFFVYGRGWASCSPERTMRRYGLRVRRLAVGDVCVSMMERRPSAPQSAASIISTPPVHSSPVAHCAPMPHNVHSTNTHSAVAASAAPPQTYPENLSVKEDARKRRWSAPDVCDDDRPPAKKR